MWVKGKALQECMKIRQIVYSINISIGLSILWADEDSPILAFVLEHYPFDETKNLNDSNVGPTYF